MIPKASGKTAPRDALDRPAGDQQADRVRERADQRADGEEDQRHEQHPLLAEHVAEAADDRRRHRGGQQVGGEDEGDRGRGGAEVVLDRGQGRGDHRLRERVGERAQHEHAEREVVVLAHDGWRHECSSIAAASVRSRRAALSRSSGASDSNTAAALLVDQLALAIEQPAAARGELHADAAAVLGRWAALDDTLALEPVEHPGRRRLARSRPPRPARRRGGRRRGRAPRTRTGARTGRG